MTMVAGARLADGVLIGADCRITWQYPNGTLLHTDDAQKLIKIGDSTVLGYAGHVDTVNFFLPHIYWTLRQPRRRRDGVSVRRWLPRYLRRSYRALARRHSVGEVHFMAAASIKGRPARIDRAVLLETVKQTHSAMTNNWLAVRCLDQLDGRNDKTLVVPDSSEGLLYVMSSPLFRPMEVPPLGVKAIGSGREASDFLDAYRPLLMCGHPRDAADVFFDALAGYFVEQGVTSVGGMLMMSHAFDGRNTSLLFSADDKSIKVTNESSYFVVRNTATGKHIRLKYPSEVVTQRPRGHLLFDDFRDAMEPERDRMRSLRQELIKRLGELHSSRRTVAP